MNLSDFTISTWVYFNSQRTNSRLFHFGYGAARWISSRRKMVTMAEAVSQLPTSIMTSNWSKFFIDTSVSLPTGQWIHLAITRLGSTATIYVNGANVGSGWMPLPMWQLPGASDDSAGIWIGRSRIPPILYLTRVSRLPNLLPSVDTRSGLSLCTKSIRLSEIR